MTAPRRYAEDTKVPVSRSHEAIKADLRKAGADEIGVMEGSRESAVVFKVRNVRYVIVVKTPEGKKNPDQELRRQWRSIALLVKAKTVAIAEGISTVEQEFLSSVVMPDGSTLADHSGRLIEQAYRDGGPPKMLLLQ